MSGHAPRGAPSPVHPLLVRVTPYAAPMGRLTRQLSAVRRGVQQGMRRSVRWGVPPGVPRGRPVVRHAVEIDGEPDPGEVVWAWVPYEDDPRRGKDRPVLLLAHHEGEWLALMLTSRDHTPDPAREARQGRYWMDVGSGGWDRAGRPSEVRLDRLVRLDDAAIRREGAGLPKPVFDAVVARAREFHDLG